MDYKKKFELMEKEIQFKKNKEYQIEEEIKYYKELLTRFQEIDNSYDYKDTQHCLTRDYIQLLIDSLGFVWLVPLLFAPGYNTVIIGSLIVGCIADTVRNSINSFYHRDILKNGDRLANDILFLERVIEKYTNKLNSAISDTNEVINKRNELIYEKNKTNSRGKEGYENEPNNKGYEKEPSKVKTITKKTK